MGQQQPAIGQDVTALMPKIGDDVTALMVSHTPETKRPEQILAESDPNYVGNDPNLGKRALERAPALGAMAATMLGPVGPIASPAMALMGGTGGALLRGDEHPVEEGAFQALVEIAGGGGRAVGQKAARGLMQGTVPKNIAKDFQGQVDIPKEMLERGVFPGVPASQQRVARLSTAANAEREAAALTVPTMPRSKVIAGLRPEYAKPALAKEQKLAQAAVSHMRESARNIGPDGLSGPAALARKDTKQRLGSAALNNPDTAAIAPQLEEAERGAILSHLRETPRMAKALDESQTLMAIDQVMKDAALSNPVTRARIGGLTAASMSPIGLGATAHAVNQGSRMVDPQMLRAIQIALLNGEQE